MTPTSTVEVIFVSVSTFVVLTYLLPSKVRPDSQSQPYFSLRYTMSCHVILRKDYIYVLK